MSKLEQLANTALLGCGCGLIGLYAQNWSLAVGIYFIAQAVINKPGVK